MNTRRRIMINKPVVHLFVVTSLLWAVFAQPHPLAAEEDLSGPPTQSRSKHFLDNGMTVLIQETPASSMVAIHAAVKTGSATEGKYLGSGISHYLEHMLFKGTKKRAVGEIGKEAKALGCYINASTSFDYTMYVIECQKENFAQALDIIADQLTNSVIDPQEVENEREVIISEVRLHRDRPERRLSELLFQSIYLRHPYRHPVIGYDASIKKITREQLWDYYKKYYIPNNIVFSVAGNVKAEEVLPMIKETFKDFERGASVSRNLPEEPEQIGPRYYEAEYPTELTRISMAYRSVRVLDRDLYALDVLAMILGKGASSRLNQEMFAKRQLVHSVRVGNFTPMDPGAFEISATLDEDKLEEVISTVKEHIELIKKKGVKKQELEKTKKQALRDHIFGLQTPGPIASDAAINEAYLGDHNFSEKYLEGLSQVTNKDIKRVANQYLIEAGLTTVVLKPLKEKEQQSPKRKSAKASEIEKIVFENGLTVLLRQNDTIPAVSIDVMFLGGDRQVPEEKSGLAHLAMQLWSRETKSRSPEKLSEEMELNGISLAKAANRHSVSFKMDSLSEDLYRALDILEDIIKNPAFTKKEFEKDVERQKTAIIARGDSIFWITSIALRETLFQSHYFRKRLIGTLESLDRIQYQDVIDFYQNTFSPDKMVIAVFGDFDREELLTVLKKKFSQLKKKDIDIVTAVAEPLSQTRRKETLMDKEQAMVMIGFHGPVLSNHKDMHSIDVVTSVLGSSLSGRMFIKIRDELGEAYTLGAGSRPGVDTGLIYFYVNTKEETLDIVTEVVLEQIEELKRNGITDDELNHSKNYNKTRFKSNFETNYAFGSLAAGSELLGLGYDDYKQYEERLDRVTKEDVRSAAQKYLDVSKAAIVTTRPKKKGDGKEK